MTQSQGTRRQPLKARWRGMDPPVVVVTGASAGVGRATAVRFARDGWKVGLIAREPARLAEAVGECRAVGSPQVLELPADVAEPDAVERAAGMAEDTLGPLDAWINAAMVTVFSPVREMTAEEFQRVTEVTYLGQVHGTLAALRRMRQRDRGSIVLVGSALAYRGLPLQSAYCGAKFAVRGFFESVRSELIHEHCGVRLGMVQLPAVNTPQFEWARSRLDKAPQPVPPIFQPETCADAIVRAAYEGNRELWVGRSSLKVILASMFAPGRWLDRQMAKQGVSGQKSDKPAIPGRPDNLLTPVAGHYGAHGRFDRRARDRAWQIDADDLRRSAGIGLVGLALVAGSLAARRLRR